MSFFFFFAFITVCFYVLLTRSIEVSFPLFAPLFEFPRGFNDDEDTIKKILKKKKKIMIWGRDGREEGERELSSLDFLPLTAFAGPIYFVSLSVDTPCLRLFHASFAKR